MEVIMSRSKQPCAGVVVSSRYVLTDGVCTKLYNQNSETLRPIYNALRPNQPSEYRVSHKIVHQGFKAVPASHHDTIPANDNIGLMKLNRPIKFAEGIVVIKLPSRGFVGRERLQMVSWGLGNGKFPKFLIYKNVQVIDMKECRKYAPNDQFLLKYGQGMLCIDPNSADVRMDWSAILVRRGNTPASDVVVGIQSVDLLQPSGKMLSIYMNIGLYKEWIQNNMRN